jgi:hypothetical protein
VQTIFINTRGLSYIHVHPFHAGATTEEMHDMQMSQTLVVTPDLPLRVYAPQAGTYKLWLQFQASGKVYVAPFILVAHED